MEEMNAGERVGLVAQRLLDRLEQAAAELDAVTVTCRRKEKTAEGETVTEHTEKLPRKKGLIDRAGLKQLTGVLKDLQEILLRDPSLDLREREARLLRLERELSQEVNADGVTVVLEGETEGFSR